MSRGAQPGKPNLLFLFSDQQHWEAVGFRDATFTTPHLDRLAGRSVVFTEAFCTSPQCSPSRSSILTGLYPSKTGVAGNVGHSGGEPLRCPTLAPALQEAGYRTGYFGKWHLGKEPEGIAGWDEDLGVTGPEVRDDEEVTRRAVAFLEKCGQDSRPFALFLSYNNPHDICKFAKFQDRETTGGVELPDSWGKKDFSSVPAVQGQFMSEDNGKVIDQAPESLWRSYREFYRERVHLYDIEVGHILAALERLWLFDRTLIVATSDHGDMDGRLGLVLKGPFFYESVIRVPLLIKPPAGLLKGLPPGPVDCLTVNTDLAPTLADFAGAAFPAGDGESLRPLIEGTGSAPSRDEVFGQYYAKKQWVNPIRMIRTRRWKYTRYQPHGEELYDLENDPAELRNLAGIPGYQSEKEELSRRLDAWMASQSDPFPGQAATTRTGEPLPPRGCA